LLSIEIGGSLFLKSFLRQSGTRSFFPTRVAVYSSLCSYPRPAKDVAPSPLFLRPSLFSHTRSIAFSIFPPRLFTQKNAPCGDLSDLSRTFLSSFFLSIDRFPIVFPTVRISSLFSPVTLVSFSHKASGFFPFTRLRSPCCVLGGSLMIPFFYWDSDLTPPILDSRRLIGYDFPTPSTLRVDHPLFNFLSFLPRR